MLITSLNCAMEYGADGDIVREVLPNRESIPEEEENDVKGKAGLVMTYALGTFQGASRNCGSSSAFGILMLALFSRS